MYAHGHTSTSSCETYVSLCSTNGCLCLSLKFLLTWQLTAYCLPPTLLLIIPVLLRSLFLYDCVRVQTFANFSTVLSCCCPSPSLSTVLKHTRHHITTLSLNAIRNHLSYLGGFCDKQTQPPTMTTPSPMSPVLCQTEPLLMTMWISIPHTRWVEFCPVVPNHQ